MNKKILKAIKIAVIIFIIATLVFSLIVSQDEHHLETCHEDHCIYCAIIHIAQNIISLSIAFVVAVVIGVLIYFFLSRLNKEQIVFVQSSLVFQKVQLNE
ncbi:MAG: hypothetical protein IKG14_04185 [Clostridia bacterium]|nr:hypothetical protein [Clostridia bacterium]